MFLEETEGEVCGACGAGAKTTEEVWFFRKENRWELHTDVDDKCTGRFKSCREVMSEVVVKERFNSFDFTDLRRPRGWPRSEWRAFRKMWEYSQVIRL